MRILFLALDVDLAKPRGDTVHAVELARALRQLGHEVSLVVGADGPVRSLLPPDVPVRAIRGPDWRVIRMIRRIARDARPEVIYERRFSPKIGLALRALAGTPIVLELNGILREELSHGAGLPRRPVKDRVRAAMLRRVDRFVAVSPAIGEDLVRSFGVDASRVRVVGNGVDTDRFRPIAKEAACGEAGLPTVPRVVFVGNLVAWRDFEVVLRALRMLRDSIPEAELLIVGGGTEEPRVRERVQELGLDPAVRYVGQVPPERVPLQIAVADIGLLPERPREVDISPLKLFEYLACGRPVVGSRVRGLELVESMGFGRLSAPGDEAEMAIALRGLFANEAARRAAGERGRSYVERERSWTAVAARVTEVLLEASHHAA